MSAEHRIEQLRALAKDLRASARLAQRVNRPLLASSLQREATRLSNDAKHLEDTMPRRHEQGKLFLGI